MPGRSACKTSVSGFTAPSSVRQNATSSATVPTTV